MLNVSSPALKYCRRDGVMLWSSMWKWILGLDVIAYYMVNFILQIWKYLINMYTFTFILLISMFLYAQAKTTFFKYNVITKHWRDMPSLQQESAVFQSHYAM